MTTPSPSVSALEQELDTFVENLAAQLATRYSLPNASGGHDTDHVRRMLALESKIASILTFDPWEYRAAVWLHNLDRVEALRISLRGRGVRTYIAEAVLRWSPFSSEARTRIADAVAEHSKKDDEPGDSSLLTALRIADKLDRLGPLGILSSVAFRGGTLPLYDAQNPFGYASTAEGKLKSVYNDLFRVLEWVGMLPSYEARALIDPNHLAAYVVFLRALGREISDRLGIENRVETDIRQALGAYYSMVSSYTTT